MSWREARSRKVKADLLQRVDASFSVLVEFGNNCHDDAGRFCETVGGVPKHELPVIHGDIPENAHDDIKHILRSRREVEPEITDTLESVAGQYSGKMLGLKYKFKKAAGVVEKIERKVKDKGITHEQSAQGISDSLRYTMELHPDNYTKGVVAAIKAMQKKGYEFQDIENNWDGPPTRDAYQGVNTVFVHPKTGLKVELQFHTKDSWDTKDVKIHKDYEYIREHKGTPASRLLAFERMRGHSSNIPVPKGATDMCKKIPGCKNIVRPNTETLFGD